MADISKITLPSGDNYYFKDAAARTNLERLSGIIPVKGTHTTTTSEWTGSILAGHLYDGLTIAYQLPFTAPSSSTPTLNLTLIGGSTTGAVPVYRNVSAISNAYTAGSTIILTYWSKGSISIAGTPSTSPGWYIGDYSNSNTIGEYAGACTAGTNGMARYCLIMRTSPNRWGSVCLTSSTGTSKEKNPSGFLLSSPILYQSGYTYTSGQLASYNCCWSTYHSLNSRYVGNVSSSWSEAGRPFFLVGTITGDKFYLKDTTWWADAFPIEGDEYFYWYVGQMQSQYQYTLHPVHPIYYYDGTTWREYIHMYDNDILSQSEINDLYTGGSS